MATLVVRTKVRLKLFSGPGMRTWPISSGYRPDFIFSWGLRTCGQILLKNEEIFLPGEDLVVEVDFGHKFAGNRLYPGAPFTIHEGRDALGNGEILEIIEVVKGPVDGYSNI